MEVWLRRVGRNLYLPLPPTSNTNLTISYTCQPCYGRPQRSCVPPNRCRMGRRKETCTRLGSSCKRSSRAVGHMPMSQTRSQKVVIIAFDFMSEAMLYNIGIVLVIFNLGTPLDNIGLLCNLVHDTQCGPLAYLGELKKYIISCGQMLTNWIFIS